MCIASGARISIVTGSTCNYNDPSRSFVVVSTSQVNLTCCVEGFPCPQWTARWYRNGSTEEISHGRDLSVNLSKPQETFICVAEANNDIPDPVCYGNQWYGSVTLIHMQGS